jgi:predicted transcriptional regulator
MQVLWAGGEPGAPRAATAKEICDALPDRALAVTTVLTVLSRLEGKALVARRRDGRAHTYTATTGREDHVASLMREALGGADDRDAALARFVTNASDAEVDALRRALQSLRGQPG